MTYSIAAGNDASLFEIDAATGALSYRGTGEDHESGTTNYSLTVRASDGTLHADVSVMVSVTDVAEAPTFNQQGYAFDLAENADGSATHVALGTVSATDPESADVTYSIAAGNDASLFEIDAATGALSYRGTGEDHESGTTNYSLTVRASDGTLHADVSVMVSVTEVSSPVSEPESGDLPADTTTTGVVVPMLLWRDPRATGEIQTPGDIDWFAMTLSADHNYRIGADGANRNDSGVAVTGIYDADGALITTNIWDFSPDTDGTYYAAVERTQAPFTGSYSIFFFEDPDIQENTDTTAFTYVNGGGGYGYLETPGDKDWVRVTLEAGASYIIDVKPAERPGLIGDGPQDFKLFSVRDATGAVIPDTEADGGGVGQNARLMFTAPTDGVYYLEIGTSDDSTGRYFYSVYEDDFAEDEATTGEVEVGGEVTGTINEGFADRDWFELNPGARHALYGHR